MASESVFLRRFIALRCRTSGGRTDQNYMIVLGAACVDVFVKEDNITRQIKMVEKRHWSLVPPPGTFMSKEMREVFSVPNSKKDLDRWTSEAVPASSGMRDFVAWLAQVRTNSSCYVVLGCQKDVLWINHYLMFHGNSVPLHGMSFDAEPFTENDVYRGDLGTLGSHFLGDAVARKRNFCNFEGGFLDPEIVAGEMGMRFACATRNFCAGTSWYLTSQHVDPEGLPICGGKDERTEKK